MSAPNDSPVSSQRPELFGGRANPRAARFAREYVVDLLILVVILAVAELSLRSIEPRFTHHLFDENHTGSNPIGLNEEGFRGRSVPQAKPPGEFRVLAVGDSVTFGVGVAAGETWPAKLERLLAAERAASVVNASFPGAGLRHLSYGIDHAWGSYRPDAVVLALSSNNVALSWTQRNQPGLLPTNQQPPTDISALRRYRSAANRVVKSFALPAALSQGTEIALYHLGLLNHQVTVDSPFGAMVAHGLRQLDVPPSFAENAWKELERDLLDAKATTERLGVPLYVTMVPTRFMISDRFADNLKAVPRNRLRISPADRTREIAERLGLRYVPALDALRSARGPGGTEPPLYIQNDYTHLDADGHAALARAMAAALR